MKKLLIALAFAGMGTVANAQTAQIEAPSKYTFATNSFWSNWYVQVGADMSIMNPYKSKFLKEDWHNGRTYGVDLGIGKWFSPGLGVRGKVQWENGQFAHAFRNTDHVVWAPDFEKGGYGAATLDVTFNLSNMLCGYSDTRVWNFIVYPRGGVVRQFDNTEYAFTLGGGIENTWKLSKLLNVYLDLSYNLLPSKSFTIAGKVPADGNEHYHAFAKAELGLQFNLGTSGWDKAVKLEDYNALQARSEEALAKLRAELDRERAANAQLRQQLEQMRNRPQNTNAAATAVETQRAAAAAQAVVTEVATSVFFDINSAKINSKKDEINLQAVAAAAKKGAKLVITGSADSKTGSSAWNQKLSESRAQAVADYLVGLGVSRDNIEVKSVGGVNEVSPYTLNRRAVISFK